MALTDEQRKSLRCSFCGKSAAEVGKLVAGPQVHICDGCIKLCNDAMAIQSAPGGDKEPVDAARARLTRYLRTLLRGNTSLLVVDIQERLSAVMDPVKLARLVKNTEILIETAKTLGLPIYSTEQYPKGLGPTVAVLRPSLTGDAAPLEKVAFSSMAVGELSERLRKSGREQVVVVGMETHVCMYQTVRDLVANGYTTFVPRDAALSRTPENHEVGLELMREVGATITSTETIVFDLLGAAGTPEFKKLSALVK